MRTSAFVGVLVLGAAIYVAAPTHAQTTSGCPNSEAENTACVTQTGDNESEVDAEGDVSGGDGVGGGQVVGYAGVSGDVDVEADNNSEHADADGGDAGSDFDVGVNSGPALEMGGTEVEIENNVTGTSEITQDADPTVTLDLEQASNPTGEVEYTNTATSSHTLFSGSDLVTGGNGGNGGNSASGLLTGGDGGDGGDAINDEAVNQNASSDQTSTFAPVMSVDGSNNADMTGEAPVTQTAEHTFSPSINNNANDAFTAQAAGGSRPGGEDLAFGGTATDEDAAAASVSDLGNTDGEARIQQTATPDADVGATQAAEPTSTMVIENSTDCQTVLEDQSSDPEDGGEPTTGGPGGSGGNTPPGGASSGAAGDGGDGGDATNNSALTQEATCTQPNDSSPEMTVDGSNDATMSGSAPVEQTATSSSEPMI